MGHKQDLQKIIQDLETKKFRDGEAKGLMSAIQEEQTKALTPVFQRLAEDMVAGMSANWEKAIKGLQVNVPEMKSTPVDVKLPEMKFADFPAWPKFPEIKMPEIKIPDIHVPEIKMPDFMTIEGEVGLKGVSKKSPLPVMLMGPDGKPFQMSVGLGGGGGGKGDFFTILGIQNTIGVVTVNPDGSPTYAAAGSSGGSTQAIDSSGNVYSAANPLPVTVVAGASTSTKAQIGNSDGDYSAANPLPVSFSAAASQNVNVFDGQASTVTSHQDKTGDFRGLDISLLRVVNVESALNSSTATLTSGSTFTGLAEDVKDFATIQIAVIADQASGTNGLSIQQSTDGSNWDITDTYTIPASTGKTFSVQVAARYFRIVYTNGGTGQTSFRLGTYLHAIAPKDSSQRPADALSNENDFTQVSTFPSAFNGSTWDRLRNNTGTADTALRVVQASDSVSSVAASQVGTWNIAVLTSITNSIAAALVDSSGVAYSGSNPLPVTGTVVVSSVTATIAALNVDSTGVGYSGSNPLPITVVSGALTSMKAQIGNSDGDFSVANPLPITGPVVVTSVTNTVAAAQVDSTGVAYSGSNPMPVTVVAGAATSTKAQIGNSDGDFTQANPLPIFVSGGSANTTAAVLTRQSNPTAVAADYVPFSADDLGRQLTRPIQVRDLIKTAYVTLSTGTEATLLAAVAGAFLDLIYIIASNTSTAAQQLDIRATTAGNIVASLYIPANASVGFSLPVPFPQDNQGNNWTVDMADVTNSNILISALFSQEV